VENIEKIKLKGTEYGVGGGGSNDAKLVERVKWFESEYERNFKLSKPLEKGLYLFVINDKVSMLNVGNIYNQYYGSAICEYNADSVLTTYSVLYAPQTLYIYISSVDEMEEQPYELENWTIEVYKLPFTLGGAE
jgi:hypothetical protein